jgi:hypothetical protein
LPASFSQIDPEVLEAIGEEEARTLRAHYERVAREKIMCARRAGARTRSKGGKNAAAAGQKTRRRFSPRRHRIRRGERASPSRTTATTEHARRISATIAVVIVRVIVKVAISRPRRTA